MCSVRNELLEPVAWATIFFSTCSHVKRSECQILCNQNSVRSNFAHRRSKMSVDMS